MVLDILYIWSLSEPLNICYLVVTTVDLVRVNFLKFLLDTGLFPLMSSTSSGAWNIQPRFRINELNLFNLHKEIS